MKPIKYPLELFSWNPFDEFGNVRVEIRDSDRNFVFYMSIKGRVMEEDKRFREELAPLVVQLLNQVSGKKIQDSESNGNGSNLNDQPETQEKQDKRKLPGWKPNPWGRAGKPK